MPVETVRGYRVVLSIAQRSVLCMLAERGRKVEMNPTNFKRQALEGLQDLHDKGLVTITELVGRVDKLYQLTELGVQVVDQIYASQKQSDAVADHAAGVERKLHEPE